MNMNNKLTVLAVLGVFVFIFFIVGIMFSQLFSELMAETKIVDVSESDILWDDEDFYIIGPDGKRITLGIDGAEILDLTKHSKVLVKFKRHPPLGLYPGSGWFVDGVVKTPKP